MTLTEFTTVAQEAATNNGVENYSIIVEPGYFTAIYRDSNFMEYDSTFYAGDACNDDVKAELNQTALNASMH